MTSLHESIAEARPLVFIEADVRAVVSMGTAIASARSAFELTRTGRLAAPAPWHLETAEGALHVKGAAILGQANFAVKMSARFPANARLGLPTSSGLSVVFDATTGAVLAVLLDNGYLTELRTGAAGGLATDLLAPAEVHTAAIIGTGGQARHQLDGLFAVRQPRVLRVCGRRTDRVAELAAWARDRWHVEVQQTTDADRAVRGADVVVTVTSSTRPLFDLNSLATDAHVTAVGSDACGKRELPLDLLTSAALVAVDSVEQSRRLGELQHVNPNEIAVLLTIGQLVVEPRPRPKGRTVADLSGLGIQDTMIAGAALKALQSSLD